MDILYKWVKYPLTVLCQDLGQTFGLYCKLLEGGLFR